MKLPKEVEELNDVLRDRWLSGIWNIDPADRQSDPSTRVKPYLWKWRDIYDSLLQAREKISVAGGNVERRVIRLVNPGMPESEMTTHTMLFSFQLIQPGEVAPAHRHTMAAIRFILQGKGAYTNVDGEKMVMEEGDLILTPQWSWHEHAHEGDEPMIWIDGLDVPLIQSLQVISFQPYREGRLPVNERTDPAAYYGMTRPVGKGADESAPHLHYRWRDTYPSLQRLATSHGDLYDGVALEYVNPVTGGSTLPTLSCWIQMLRPGERTKSHRHTSTSIYHAFRGSGTTLINDEPFHWEKGDTFIVPLWSWHEHANRSPSDDA
ncbi:MAG TPA: cupin domain-containing protein, partial [Candidatus Binatia bacterium]|nr:cupin domain-containing protein [Candidatus Binatia bacterium]